MSYFYNLLIYNPLLNILIFFYNTIAFKDLGVAIIFLTILVRIALYPLSLKIFKQQLILQKLQPEITKIKKKHKDDPIKQFTEISNLYKQNNINQFSIYFLTFIQIPILFALFKIFSKDFKKDSLVGLYSFIYHPPEINTTLFGIISLTGKSMTIAILAASLQYLYAKITTNQFKQSSSNHQQDTVFKFANYFNIYGTTFFIFLISATLPAAVGLYLATTNIISFLTQILISNKLNLNELGGIHTTNN